jgi:polyhydroxyalkanoate synthesis repressor PhaR
MPVIKRYPNRKLYDTAARRYISLDGIADLIRDGAEVQVVEHDTGDDLTALILMQIIVEQEKRQSGFLPRPVFASLVQLLVLGGRAMFSGWPDEDSVKRALTRHGVPARSEFQSLADRLSALEAELDALSGT